jgi:hypothetical protein
MTKEIWQLLRPSVIFLKEVLNMKRHWFVVILAGGLICGWIAGRMQAQQQSSDSAQKAKARAEAVARKTPLDTLDWLVGDWVATGDQMTADFSCDYTKNESFLFRPFRIVQKNGDSLSGTQVIAWDPMQATIRSWTFDSMGGFGEETWSQSGNRYSIRAKYILPDGGTGSAIHVLTYIDDNTATWKSVNREIDGVLQPDTAEVTLVRKDDGSDAKGGN